MSNNKISRKGLYNNIMQACDIMRTDAGTTGILEYIEQLSWLIFLKVFEDIENRNKIKAEFDGKTYKPIIKEEYHWTNWTTKDDSELEEFFTKAELEVMEKRDEPVLIAFINNNLFPYLRGLSDLPEKELIRDIFQELKGNLMKSPYNLRDVITLLDRINFDNTEDSHVLSQVYEELLLKLGREAGIAGEFYTPRPIIRLMTKILKPKIEEKILDPFCGSGGFIIESFHLMRESKELTFEDHQKLQRDTFYGQEKKPLPYLIGVMNCILHNLLRPNFIRTNTLEEDIRSIPEDRKFDIILTNPPFGGKEGKHIQQNFPYRSSKTEILALQYVIKKLRSNGRCGIVVPEGILYNSSEKAYVSTKKDLLQHNNLHSIISLPPGAFANVSPSGQGPKTNLLFFEKKGSTKEVFYYDFAGYSKIVLNKNYSKANPILDEDLLDAWKIWEKKKLTDWSWKVSIEDIIENDYDITTRNPNRTNEVSYREPSEIVEDIITKEQEIQQILTEVRKILNGE